MPEYGTQVFGFFNHSKYVHICMGSAHVDSVLDRAEIQERFLFFPSTSHRSGVRQKNRNAF